MLVTNPDLGALLDTVTGGEPWPVERFQKPGRESKAKA